MKKLISAVVVAMSIGAVSSPVYAGDVQGDAYDCKELWVMRNQIYKDNGYCFKTTKAINYFGNAGCQFDDLSDVPLSKAERRMVRDIQRSERRQGC